MTRALPSEFDRAEAADIGLSWRALDDLLALGQIAEISWGFYRRTDAESADTDLLEISLRSPRATSALTSALAHHGLIDEIPSRIDIALPRGAHRPKFATAIAEKTGTVLKRGSVSSRWRDMMDVRNLALTYDFDFMELCAAVETVAKSRGVELISFREATDRWAEAGQTKWSAWRSRQQYHEKCVLSRSFSVSTGGKFGD